MTFQNLRALPLGQIHRPTKETQIRAHEPGRKCESCGRALSVYNAGPTCYPCHMEGRR